MSSRPFLGRRRLSAAAVVLTAFGISAATLPTTATAAAEQSAPVVAPAQSAPTSSATTTPPAGANVTANAARDFITWRSGVYSGISRAENDTFAAWRGRPLSSVLLFQPSGSVAEMVNPSIAAQYRGSGVRVTLSTGFWPGTVPGSLRQAAYGEYNAIYRALAQNLVNAGAGNVTFRMGWEFNGDWMPWRVLNRNDAIYFGEAWRQFVKTVRSVPGQSFTFDWAPVAIDGLIDPARSWPGSAFVDFVGMSVYNYTPNALQTPAALRFRQLQNFRYGLFWHVAFATKFKKPISYPEWAGLNRPFQPETSSGDDDYFIAAMYYHFRRFNISYENYFDVDTPNFTFYGINTGANINAKSAAVYRQLWAQPIG